jgi:hypothetical protein
MITQTDLARGWQLPASEPGEALTPPEQATFELVPAEH